MLTTKQVRAIMRERTGFWAAYIYTNQVKDKSVRHVKCYYNPNSTNDVALFNELKRKAGADNVWLTKGTQYRGARLPGLVVRCKLA